jgi:cysteine desulfurase/selenocysteine lyase
MNIILHRKIKPINFELLRHDFPILQQTNRGKPLVYLDSGASSQKPYHVIDAISQYYRHDHANIHRGIYELSERTTKAYENVRKSVKDFINAAHQEEVIFVRGTTEAINLVAQSLGRTDWQAGDEVIVSEMEHHANIVPWVMLRDQIGIKLKIIPLTDSGELDLAAYQKLFSPRTRLVAITHASNVLGVINPLRDMIITAHQHVPVLVDGAQAVPHMPVDVRELDCDFYAFSSHKAYGPTGVGVLYGKREWLDKMPPYQGGGGMIESVSFDAVTYAQSPQKFEAGTPDIANVIGFARALRYLQDIGMGTIFAHEQALLEYMEDQLMQISGLRMFGAVKPKLGVISFIVDGIHPHDLGTVLDHEGIAVRAGHHCAMPLMTRLGVPATVRASLGLYNDRNDIDALADAIRLAKRLFS